MSMTFMCYSYSLGFDPLSQKVGGVLENDCMIISECDVTISILETDI
jgi:hypothetical protein